MNELEEPEYFRSVLLEGIVRIIEDMTFKMDLVSQRANELRSKREILFNQVKALEEQTEALRKKIASAVHNNSE